MSDLLQVTGTGTTPTIALLSADRMAETHFNVLAGTLDRRVDAVGATEVASNGEGTQFAVEVTYVLPGLSVTVPATPVA